jgi:hypothetical protein
VVDSLVSVLTEAYLSVSYGNDEPDLLWLSPNLMLEFVKIFPDVYETEDGRITRFMNASVKCDSSMKDGEFSFVNSKHPVGTPDWDRFLMAGKVEL